LPDSARGIFWRQRDADAANWHDGKSLETRAVSIARQMLRPFRHCEEHKRRSNSEAVCGKYWIASSLRSLAQTLLRLSQAMTVIRSDPTKSVAAG
jgi:hypothetical protein